MLQKQSQSFISGPRPHLNPPYPRTWSHGVQVANGARSRPAPVDGVFGQGESSPPSPRRRRRRLSLNRGFILRHSRVDYGDKTGRVFLFSLVNRLTEPPSSPCGAFAFGGRGGGGLFCFTLRNGLVRHTRERGAVQT